MLDAARLAGIWVPGGIHTTDRAFEYETSWIESSDLLIVDDIVGTGKTLDAILTKAEGVRPRSIEVEFIACKAEWPITIEILKRRHPDVKFSGGPRLQSQSSEFTHEIVRAISSIPRPYNLDWPLMAGWRLTREELDWLCADPRFVCGRHRDDLFGTSPAFVTLEASDEVRQAIADFNQLPVENLGLTKIRVYAEPLNGRTANLCVLGIVSFVSLTPQDQQRLADFHGIPALGLIPTQRLLQYELSLQLMRLFRTRGETLLGRGAIYESKWQRNLGFGPSVRFDNDFVPLDAAPKRQVPVNGVSHSDSNQLRFLRNGLISEMIESSRTSAYRKGRIRARGERDHQVQFLDKTPSRESFSFLNLLSISRSYSGSLGDEEVRQEVSAVLDDAIDSGATVPGFRIENDCVVRTFRAGETIRYSQREQNLLLSVLGEALYGGTLVDLENPRVKLTKTFVEKYLVLAVRYGAKRKQFREILDRSSAGVPTLTVSFSRHGSILDTRPTAVQLPIANDRTLTLGSLLGSRGLIQWRDGGDRKRPHAVLTAQASVPQEDLTSDYQNLGSVFFEISSRNLIEGRDLEALATLCDERQHPLALLAEADRIRPFLASLRERCEDGSLTSRRFEGLTRWKSDAAISIRESVLKMRAISTNTARTASDAILAGLDRRDQVTWEDISRRIFIEATAESTHLTIKSASWLLRMADTLDSLRVALRMDVRRALPSAAELSDISGALELEGTLSNWRSKYPRRDEGLAPYAHLLMDLIDECVALESEIKFWYDSEGAPIHPRRFRHAIAFADDSTNRDIAARLTSSSAGRHLFAVPTTGPFDLFAVAAEGFVEACGALAAIVSDAAFPVLAIAFDDLADESRLLHRERTDLWLTASFDILAKSIFDRLEGQLGLFQQTTNDVVCIGVFNHRGRSAPAIKSEESAMKLSEIDLLMVCATELEWGWLQRNAFGGSRSTPKGRTRRHFLDGSLAAGSGVLSVAAANPTDQGTEEMLIILADALSVYRPRCIALVGIAGGVSGDLAIGDVAVAKTVMRYDRGKEVDGKVLRQLVPSTLPTDQVNLLSGYVSNLNNVPELRASTNCAVYLGSYAAGEKVLADELSDTAAWIRSVDRKVLCVEMESGGFFKSLLSQTNPNGSEAFWFVCKGVSDHADAGSMGSAGAGATEEARRAWQLQKDQNQEQATASSVAVSLLIAHQHLSTTAE